MELFEYKKSVPVWASFENPTGSRAQGGLENNGAKGHPFEYFRAGEEKVLCDIQGSGVIRRIWFTLMDRSPEMLSGIMLSAYWENAEKPAFSLPIGDFFCMGNGHMCPFENAYFASPEGRSFICSIPMPFKQGAKLTLRNITDKDNTHLFYDVNLTMEELPADILHFYASYTVTERAGLGCDVVALPTTQGRGRFLGMTLAVCPDAAYQSSWWGEGEVKIYLDGEKIPSLVGTGLEDYLGTAWGQGTFINRFQGCTLCEDKAVSFYRFHTHDPIYFEKGCTVEFQDIGGAPIEMAKALMAAGAEMIPTGADIGGRMIHLYQQDWTWENLPSQSFITFYRRDSFKVTAYYYLQR